MKIEEKTASEVDVFIKQLIAKSLLFDIIMNALHPFMGQKGYEKSQKMFWKHDDWLSIICIYIYTSQKSLMWRKYFVSESAVFMSRKGLVKQSTHAWQIRLITFI